MSAFCVGACLTLPPPEPLPPAETQRPHRPPIPRPDTTQQRTDQSRAHPQVHDDGPDAAATETDVAAAAAMQPRVELHPPPPPRRTPATASDSETEVDQTGVTAGARTTRQRKRKRPVEDPPPLLGLPRSAAPRQEAEKPHPGSSGTAPPPPAGNPHPGLTPKHPPPCARWPGTPGSWLAGHFPWVLVWTGACYWHGVGGFMFNSSRCGNRHQKLGAYYFDEGFFT